ncbi:MAG: von Willebrand factor type A domain-containing protein [Verrucomicrobiales bacterium]|nr:von Willebrand factor type A domain-containing protein [Verrucomicrobiales bacterium]
MKIDSEDPRLTAYALGELDPSEADAFERILEECPETKLEVDAIRDAITTIKEEFAEAPKKKLSEEQKQILFSNEEDIILDPGPGAFSKINKWLGVTAAAACFVGMGLVGLRSVKQELQEDSDYAARRDAATATNSPKLILLEKERLLMKQSENEGQLSELSKERTEKALAAAPFASADLADSKESAAGFADGATLPVGEAIVDYSSNGIVDKRKSKQQVGKKASPKPSNLRANSIVASAKAPSSNDSLSVGDLRLRSKSNESKDRGFLKESDKRDEIVGEEQNLSREQYGVYYDTPFFPTLERPLSTFAIDVDTASYSNVRRYIGRRGQLPPVDAVRVEELINYFDYDYPYSGDKHPFSVHLETSSAPWKAGHRLVRIGLKAKDMNVDKRPPSNLVFLVDCSGSMGNPDKLPLLKKSLVSLVENLTEDDRIGIVTYAGGAGVELDPLHGDQKDKIIEVINGLRSGGGTNGEGGNRVAYDLATKNYIKGGTNRVILATDGDFNVGISDNSKLVELVKGRAEKEKIFLTALGFGEGNIQDARLEQIANNGNGEYYYIDSIKEGRRVLVDKMSATLVTVAKDVKIQVDFNPRKVRSYRLIGYANRRMRAEEFRDDKKDAGEIGAGHVVTALYEIVPAGSTNEEGDVAVKSKYRKSAKKADKGERSDIIESEELLTVFLRYKGPEDDIEDEAKEFSVPLTDSGNGWENSSKDFRFASSVAGFGMLLRNSKFGGQVNYDLLLELASEGIGDDKNGLRKEFVELVKKAKAITLAKSDSE